MHPPPELKAQIHAQAGPGQGVNLNVLIPAKGRAAHTPGRMNKTEALYADQLDYEKRAGDVLWWAFEPMKLRLADKTYYTVDFLVMIADGTLECREVKGHWEDDARVKWKVAAEQYPIFRFVAITRVKKKWKEERYR